MAQTGHEEKRIWRHQDSSLQQELVVIDCGSEVRTCALKTCVGFLPIYIHYTDLVTY